MATRRSARNSRRSIAAASTRAEEAASSGSSRPRSRRRGGAGDEGAGGPRPSVGRDGKAAISCPNCAARYRLAEENLESKVTCTQCHRAFFPLASAGARRKPVDNSKPIIYGIVGVFAIIIVGVLINYMSKSAPETPKKKSDAPVVVDTGGNTPEVRAVRSWAQAVGDKDTLNTELYSDLAALQKLFAIEPKVKFEQTFGDKKKELTKQILDALFTADQTLVFRAYKPSYGSIVDPAMVAKKTGRVKLSLYPRDSSVHSESAEVEVSYGFDPRDNRFRVDGWNVVTMARADFLAEKLDNKTSKKKHQKHKLIGATTKRATTFAGKKIEVEEAELVPLPHLDSTSPEDRKEIDSLIDKLVDIHASGMHFNRAARALEKYGKAAIPRVLNKMYETKMGSQDDVLVVNRLCRFLRTLSGWRFGFSPQDHKGSDLGGSEKERISALKQWYAWWARYHDRDDWQNFDSEDEVEMTSDQIEKKHAAEREARKKAREEKRRKARGGSTSK
ncbi:MAG: hypothetical protein H6836_08645 [Planctomycetes bacterium]|nr:hypothetical protein [Planctomycetota bacterium]